MMEFVVLTVAIMLAILLASFVACVIMFQPKVTKWYLKKVFKMTNEITEELCEGMAKDL